MNSYIHKNNILDLLENNTSLKTKTKNLNISRIIKIMQNSSIMGNVAMR